MVNPIIDPHKDDWVSISLLKYSPLNLVKGKPLIIDYNTGELLFFLDDNIKYAGKLTAAI